MVIVVMMIMVMVMVMLVAFVFLTFLLGIFTPNLMVVIVFGNPVMMMAMILSLSFTLLTHPMRMRNANRMQYTINYQKCKNRSNKYQ